MDRRSNVARSKLRREKPVKQQVESQATQKEPEALNKVAESEAVCQDAIPRSNDGEAPENNGVQLIAGTRYASESDAAVVACNDWLRLGPGRTLRALLAIYTQPPGLLEYVEDISPAPHDVAESTETDQNRPNLRQFVADRSVGEPPTKSIGTLKDWSSHFGWKQRAREYDAPLEDLRDQEYRRVMNSGFALMENRVESLNSVAEVLHQMIQDKTNWFVAGPHDAKILNTPLFKAYHGVLSDIAAELGGRHEYSDYVKWAKQAVDRIDIAKLSPEQFHRMADGENPLMIVLEPYLKKE